MMFLGCAGPREAAAPPEPAERTVYTAPPARERAHTEPARGASVEMQREGWLRDAVADWEGTPYRYGGEGRNGIDCSAFAMIVYSDVFRIRLPRTTGDQVEEGVEVYPEELKPGDLVFFRPSGKSRHVGIYLSGGEFAHASTSQGVTVSRLDHPYWVRNYWTSRRILDERGAPAEPLSAVPPRDAPTIRDRKAEAPAERSEPAAYSPTRKKKSTGSGRHAGW